MSVETVHGRFQFINAPEEEPTMVARLPQQVLLLLVLGEWNTISVSCIIYIYIFRLGPIVLSLPPRASHEKYLGPIFRSRPRGRASRCYLFDRGGGGAGFSLIRGRFEDSTVDRGRNEWHRANSNIPISIAKRCITNLIIGHRGDGSVLMYPVRGERFYSSRQTCCGSNIQNFELRRFD